MLIFTPTLKLIISRTLPLTAGVFAIMMVQLVDTIFIGQLGLNELTVQGVTLPFHTILIGVQVGLGVAATCIISQAAGAKQNTKAAATASISVLFGVLLIATICLTFWLFSEHILSVFVSGKHAGDTLPVLQNIFSHYWPLWLFSALGNSALYLISAVYRANENTKTPGLMLVAASVINLILDPILIFYLELGIAGAAIASAIAFYSCAIYLLYKARPEGWFSRIRFDSLHLDYFKDLIGMTLPTTANQILPSVSAFFTMLLISGIGTDAIAFWSLLSRMEMFLLVFSLSLTMSVPPIVGRYLGEGNCDKVSELLSTTIKFLLGFHLLVAFFIALTSGLFVPVITDNEQLSYWLAFAFWIIPFSYGPLGLCMVIVSAFNALGLPRKALLISFMRLFVFYLPAILAGTQTNSVTNTVIAATIANLLAGLNAWVMLKQYFSKAHPKTMQAI